MTHMYESEHVIQGSEFFNPDSDLPFLQPSPGFPSGGSGFPEPENSFQIPVDDTVESKLIRVASEYRKVKNTDTIKSLMDRVKLIKEMRELLDQMEQETNEYKKELNSLLNS